MSDPDLYARALSDVVDILMSGEEYPKRQHGPQINLTDLLCDVVGDGDSDDRIDLAVAVANHFADEFSGELEKVVRRIVEDRLRETRWVELRCDELQEEDAE